MKKRLNGILTLLLVLVVQVTFAQQLSVTGTVIDESGLPLPGVNVIIEGTNRGTQTDFDGNYSISASTGEVIIFSYVGYATGRAVVGQNPRINATLSVDAAALEEVIVTGFGNVSKTSYTGSAKVVSGEQISQKAFTNVSQALAGEAAGVQVYNTSGQPGSVSTIRIRGFGSINGSQAPLYIVDDAPFGGSLNDINPNDIQSVTVLKDASATALYGARGANGVVVITTKKGQDDRLNVSLKTGINYEGIDRYETITSPEEYIGIAWEGIYQRGLIANNGDQAAAVAYANRNLFTGTNQGVSEISPVYNMWNIVDSGALGVSQLIDPATATVRPGVTRRYTPESWKEFAFQPSNRTEANVSLSNSGKNSSIYTSVGFIDDIGYASNTDYQRINARLTANNRLMDFVDMTTSLNYAQSEANNNGTGSSSSSQFWWIDNSPPIYPLFRRDAAGNKIPDPIYGGFLYDYGLEDGRGFGFATNGVADSQINISNSKDNSVNFNNDLKIDLFEGLTFENNFAYQYFMSDDTGLDEPFYSPAKGEGGRIDKSRSETKNYSLRTGLRYTKNFGVVNLNSFVSHVATSNTFNYLFASRSNLVTPFGTEIANGVVNNPSDGYSEEEKTESYIANATLDFYNKYFLNATFNRDASSRFVNNKWGNFYAVGAAWILSEENFMANADFIDFLKLKASYGVLGNSGGIGLFPGYNLYSINNLNNNISLAFTTRGNPDLTWESSNQFNTGLEFELGNFVEGSVEYYRKTTTDMFFLRSVGPSNGYANLRVNDGEMLNSGVEFDLDFRLVNNSKFRLNLGVNGSMLNNELVALPIDPTTGVEQLFDEAGSYGRAAGRSLYDWYMPVYAGVDPATGAAQWERHFEDVNNDGVYGTGDVIITSLTSYLLENPDATILQDLTQVYAQATDKFVDKTAIPDVSGSFRLSATYGSFSLSTLFAYSFGGWSYDNAYAALMNNNYAGTHNYHVDLRNRWRAPGDITDIPRQDARGQIQQSSVSTRFLTKADFVALNNVRLGWEMPKTFVESMGLENLGVFLTGDNLALWSERKGFNPSTSVTGSSDFYRYNPLSTVVFGVNLTL